MLYLKTSVVKPEALSGRKLAPINGAKRGQIDSAEKLAPSVHDYKLISKLVAAVNCVDYLYLRCVEAINLWISQLPELFFFCI